MIVTDDWIWDVRVLDIDTEGTCTLVVGTGHNCVITYSVPLAVDGVDDEASVSALPAATVAHTLRSTVVCLLYSCSFCTCHPDCRVVASGTVFNKVLLWSYGAGATGLPAAELVGHTGVLFRMEWSHDGACMLSVSDDRSVRFWSCLDDEELARPDLGARCVGGGVATADPAAHPTQHLVSDLSHAHYREGWAGFGHAARLWSAKFSPRCVVSCSEDTVVCLWSYQGRALATLEVRFSRVLSCFPFQPAHAHAHAHAYQLTGGCCTNVM